MQTPEQLSAELYDASVPDWEGEIDFYRELAGEVKARVRGHFNGPHRRRL